MTNANAQIACEVWPCLAALLDSPGADWAERVDAARRVVRASPSCDAARELDQCIAALELLSPHEREELHARTFDLSPSCIPYVSVHLFGEESFQRADLMTGLAAAYARAGFDPGGELPDHLAVILRFAPLCPPDEWRDLARLVVLRGLAAMRSAIEGKQNDVAEQKVPPINPYAHLLRAMELLFRIEFPMEADSLCSTPSSSSDCLTSPSLRSSADPFSATGSTGSAIPGCPLSSLRTGSCCGEAFPGTSES